MKTKIFVPKNPRLSFDYREVHTIYFRGYLEEYDGDDYTSTRNTRKEGYLVSYAYEYWNLGYEEPDFGEGDIATFSSFKSALEWINRHGVIDHRVNFMSYIYLIESDKYVYTAYNILKSTKRSEKFYKDAVSDNHITSFRFLGASNHVEYDSGEDDFYDDCYCKHNPNKVKRVL